MDEDVGRGADAAAQVTRAGAAAGAVAAVALAGLGATSAVGAGPLLAAGAGVAAGLLGAFGWLLYGVARPIDRLARDLAIVARDNPRHGFRLPDRHAIGRLAAAAGAVRDRLAEADGRAAAALGEATAELDLRQRQLEAILLDLSEGVVVCDLSHRVLLYNQAAADQIDPPLTLGLGRPLLASLAEEPIAHHLERLTGAEGAAAGRPARFVCGTVDGRRLLHARMALMRDADGAPNGYVLTLGDVGGQLQAVAARDELLVAATEGQRAPLANLRAAAETLAGHGELEPAQRAAFERVILEESGRLSERLDELARAHRDLGAPPWAMAEIHSTDLIAALARRVAGGADGPKLTPTGLPQWLLGDSLALRVLLEDLVRRLHAEAGIDALDVAVTPAGRDVNLDLVWCGDPVAADALEDWLERPLAGGGLGPVTGRAVLQRHGTDLWSQPGRAGEALLRLPLPAAEPVAAAPARAARPPRPEFYDFDLLARPVPAGDLAERPLAELSYLVFDFETTGLQPSAGDRPVALGAVRVVNGRVLTLETFERLIDPGRPIPAESTRFHGITDDMVRGKPPFELVLPQFHGFAADSVLVAHNAAFELAFLDQGARAAGLAFDQPVLDTLLLSAYLDGPEEDHSLDAVARRYGLAPAGRRHAALSDALLTGAVLVRQIERLAGRGLTRLGQVVMATNMLAQLRANRAAF